MAAEKLYAAAEKIDVTPPEGVPVADRTAPGALSVNGPLHAAVLLLRRGDDSVCWISLNQCYLSAEYEAAVKQPICGLLGIDSGRILIGCTRNLSTPLPFHDAPRARYHDEIIDRILEAVRRSSGNLKPASLGFREGSWPDLQYNRKGVREDGTTFFRREEDRIRQPEPVGLIDPRIPVLRIDDTGGRPIAVVTQYIGDPCVATQLERPVISPDVPGYASDQLARTMGNPDLPVLYFQGAKGDIAIKYMFEGEEKAKTEGEKLGDYMAELAASAVPMDSCGLAYSQGTAVLPLQDLPSPAALAREKEEFAAYYEDIREGKDMSARIVVGHNLPSTITPAFREVYAGDLEKWTDWAIRCHEEGKDIPRSVPFRLHVFRLGEFAVVSTWAELFGRIGLDIRSRSPFPKTIVACCCGPVFPDTPREDRSEAAGWGSSRPPEAVPRVAAWAYVPGAADLDGNEYMSSFYRHTRYLTQYEYPAGDLIADKAVELLHSIK